MGEVIPSEVLSARRAERHDRHNKNPDPDATFADFKKWTAGAAKRWEEWRLGIVSGNVLNFPESGGDAPCDV